MGVALNVAQLIFLFFLNGAASAMTKERESHYIETLLRLLICN
jgi:hypothetical protein